MSAACDPGGAACLRAELVPDTDWLCLAESFVNFSPRLSVALSDLWDKTMLEGLSPKIQPTFKSGLAARLFHTKVPEDTLAMCHRRIGETFIDGEERWSRSFPDQPRLLPYSN